jgi:hypothetical protein
MTKFRCSTCGQEHDMSDISFGADVPAQWDLLREEEKAVSERDDESCVIRAEGTTSYYIRRVLEVPIRGEDYFTWGVWTSLSKKSFDEVMEHWLDPGRSTSDRTSTGSAPLYPDTRTGCSSRRACSSAEWAFAPQWNCIPRSTRSPSINEMGLSLIY